MLQGVLLGSVGVFLPVGEIEGVPLLHRDLAVGEGFECVGLGTWGA